MRISSAAKSALTAGIMGLLSFGFAPMSADATTVSTTFSVTATVVATCLVSATPLSFGNYTGMTNPASSTVSVTCTNTTPYSVGLSAGLATGATVTTRKMTGPASALLGYGLFQNIGHTINWGVSVGTDTVPGIGSGAAQAITIFGQIPAAEYVAPGAYTDTITATITY